jgi:hypothetical protein
VVGQVVALGDIQVVLRGLLVLLVLLVLLLVVLLPVRFLPAGLLAGAFSWEHLRSPMLGS